jgi:hypothetical protein
MRVTGGAVEFQNWAQLSQGFQLWWFGAKKGDKLVLRAKLEKTGSYDVSAVFGGNRDFGESVLKIGNADVPLSFKNDNLTWGMFNLGKIEFSSDEMILEFTAMNSANQDGVVCHVAIDYLLLRKSR